MTIEDFRTLRQLPAAITRLRTLGFRIKRGNFKFNGRNAYLVTDTSSLYVDYPMTDYEILELANIY